VHVGKLYIVAHLFVLTLLSLPSVFEASDVAIASPAKTTVAV